MSFFQRDQAGQHLLLIVADVIKGPEYRKAQVPHLAPQ